MFFRNEYDIILTTQLYALTNRGEFINIYDISQKAGVSIATISRVINCSDNVSEKTRQKVLKVIKEMGYTPNIFARGLGLNSMNTIGVMCADSSDIYLSSAIYFLEQGLRSYHYDCLLCCTGYELETKKKYLDLLISKRVDAIILVGSNFIEPNKKEHQYIIECSKKVPVILLNGFIKADNIYCVSCNDTQIIYEITKNLITSSKEILYLNRNISFASSSKLAGFLKAFKDMNLTLSKWQVKNLNSSIESTKQMLIELKSSGINFNSIICSDDELAIGAIKYAKALDIEIPDELEIIGYNNSKISLCCIPELSSVDNKLEFSCFNAISILMRVLNNQEVPNNTIISAELINRETTTQ